MTVFDFFKKLFGWADQRSLKRKADVDVTIEQEFTTPKKHRCNYKTQHVQKTYIELDKDSDSDDVTVVNDGAYLRKTSCNKSNGINSCSKQKYTVYPTSYHSCFGKTSASCSNHKESKMGYSSGKLHKTQTSSMDWCPTLSKTFQDRERHQYVEMLQNFVSPRIHVIRDEHKEQQCVEPEVIDLEASGSTEPSYKVDQIRRQSSTAACGKWRSANKSRNKTMESSKDDYSNRSSYSKVEVYKNDTDTKKPMTLPPIKSISMNSLKDSLAAKAVMRNDFIPEVAKKYDERIEQRYKEVEQLKKMTNVLSKRNRWSREVALEEQLNRSMRLCEAVLEDKEESEPSLPEITDEMMREVKNALIPHPPGEILVEGFGLRVTRKDMNTLADLNWLNDEVINFYMNLLIARGTGEKYPKVYAMNTFFYPKLVSSGHSSLKRWTRKIDIFAQDLIVVPVHLGIHWCMSIIDFRDKTIRYYDSMGGNNTRCLSALRQYLEEESLDKKKQKYDTSEWKLENVKDMPQQMNGSDCGVFSCVFAEHICANRKINFSQKDMRYFRNKMVYEILKSKLL